MDLTIGGFDRPWVGRMPTCEFCKKKMIWEDKSFCKYCLGTVTKGGYRWFRISTDGVNNSISRDCCW